jgi:hypothetical protein
VRAPGPTYTRAPEHQCGTDLYADTAYIYAALPFHPPGSAARVENLYRIRQNSLSSRGACDEGSAVALQSGAPKVQRHCGWRCTSCTGPLLTAFGMTTVSDLPDSVLERTADWGCIPGSWTQSSVPKPPKQNAYGSRMHRRTVPPRQESTRQVCYGRGDFLRQIRFAGGARASCGCGQRGRAAARTTGSRCSALSVLALCALRRRRGDCVLNTPLLLRLSASRNRLHGLTRAEPDL